MEVNIDKLIFIHIAKGNRLIQGNKEENYQNDMKPYQKSPDTKRSTNNINQIQKKMNNILSLKQIEDEKEDYTSPNKKIVLKKMNNDNTSGGATKSQFKTPVLNKSNILSNETKDGKLPILFNSNSPVQGNSINNTNIIKNEDPKRRLSIAGPGANIFTNVDSMSSTKVIEKFNFRKILLIIPIEIAVLLVKRKITIKMVIRNQYLAPTFLDKFVLNREQVTVQEERKRQIKIPICQLLTFVD